MVRAVVDSAENGASREIRRCLGVVLDTLHCYPLARLLRCRLFVDPHPGDLEERALRAQKLPEGAGGELGNVLGCDVIREWSWCEYKQTRWELVHDHTAREQIVRKIH